MTSDGKLYTYVYDAFGRLRFIKNRTTGNLIEEYTYNALNQRVGQHYDVNANGSVGSEDPWLNFIYDDKWRIVATVRGSGGTNGNQTIESSPKELFVYHNAGLGGFGSSSYIDSVILVDQDNTNGLMIGGSAGASDGTLESRRFVMQNWRADVVCTASATGAPLERVRYSAYGVPTLMRVADYNQDGGLDYNDYDAFYADWEEQTGIAADLNLDGVISMADHDLFAADYDTNPTKIGRTHQSAYGVRKGYAGYENDGVISRFSHVRHRVYDNELARWTRRDPVGYVDGANTYTYVSDSPLDKIDPLGLSSCTSGGGILYIEPWRLFWSDELLSTCSTACASTGGKANAVAWCLNGSPIVCVCTTSPSNPSNNNAGKSFAAQYAKCQEAYEIQQWSSFVHPFCPAGFTGNPHAGDSTRSNGDLKLDRCLKSRALADFAACIRNIDCNITPENGQTQYDAAQQARQCRHRRCVESRQKECLAKGYQAYCDSPPTETFKDAQKRDIEIQKACLTGSANDCNKEANAQ